MLMDVVKRNALLLLAGYPLESKLSGNSTGGFSGSLRQKGHWQPQVSTVWGGNDFQTCTTIEKIDRVRREH